jgi:hypothetical protein
MHATKYISLVLLICFSAFLGHNLIPHHHHADSAHIDTQGHCPVNHKEHHDSDDPPSHCHAFNDVEFIKITPTYMDPPVCNATSLLFSLEEIQIEKQISYGISKYICLKLPIKTIEYMVAIPLRAPPVYS